MWLIAFQMKRKIYKQYNSRPKNQEINHNCLYLFFVHLDSILFSMKLIKEGKERYLYKIH